MHNSGAAGNRDRARSLQWRVRAPCSALLLPVLPGGATVITAMNTDKPDHWDPTTSTYCYAKVCEHEVIAEIRERVSQVVGFVCVELRLSARPTIVWIRPAQQYERPRTGLQRRADKERTSFPRLPNDICGGYTPAGYLLDEIWIRTDLLRFPDLECVRSEEH